MAVNSGWWNTVHPDGKILLFPFGGLLLVSEQIAKPPKWSKWWFLIGIKIFSESFSSLKIIRYLVKEPCSYWRHAIFNWTEPDCWRTSSLMEHPSGCFGSLMFAGRPWWFWNQTDLNSNFEKKRVNKILPCKSLSWSYNYYISLKEEFGVSVTNDARTAICLPFLLNNWTMINF